MAILCGHDFTPQASGAADVAALMAARAGEEVLLAHVLGTGTDRVYAGAHAALREAAEKALAEEAARLSGLGARVRTEVLEGPPDEALAAHASRAGARLVVIAALSHRAAAVWRLGGTAARVALCSEVPVLVVRGDASRAALSAWARGERPLRVLVGIDRSPTSDAAVRWLGELGRVAPLEVVWAHVYWPPEEYRRIGLRGTMPLVGPHAVVEELLQRELVPHVRSLTGAWDLKLRLVPGFGRTDEHLIALASEEQTELVVVGTHRREGLGRLWHGSVSYGVLDGSPVSVACVPTQAAAAWRDAAVPHLGSVLVATDFSANADRAIPWAFGAVAPGGVVHLVHVVPSTPEPAALAELERQLAERIPDAGGHAATRVEVLTGEDVAEAICQAAERRLVDVVCLGSHGRTGALRAILGSVAQAVVGKSRRPVLVVRGQG